MTHVVELARITSWSWPLPSNLIVA